MDDAEVIRRLNNQETLLRTIVAALAPPEEEDGSGFDDLVEALSDLTVATAEVMALVRQLPCNGCALRHPQTESASGAD